MTPEVENVLRSVARECHQAIKAGIKGKKKKEYDAIFSAELDAHARKVATLPVGKFHPKRWLAYYVSLIDKESRGEA